jgi:N-acetylglucosamine-6-phosphate deacetylase
MSGCSDFCLFSDRVILPDREGPFHVRVREGRIESVRESPPPGARVESFDGAWLGPGFIDVHTHGLAGVGVTAEALDGGGVTALSRAHAEHGVTAYLLSTMTAPEAELVDVLTAAARAAARAESAPFLGIHLEGPFLSSEFAGAQDPRHCSPADVSEADRLLQAGEGVVRSMTLAPERDSPELAVVRLLAERGVVVSLGHSAADVDTARRAADAGATTVTHLFNAMPPLHHRRPGLVGAALTDDALVCELISDGVHLEPAVVALAVRAKGASRCVLVSDSIPATGLGDGEHRLGSAVIHVRDGIARTPEGRLAGSTLTLDRAVLDTARWAGVPVATAARMASQVPAKVLRDSDRGRIAAGRRADLVAFDEQGVRMTMVGGEVVWRRKKG